MNILIWVRRILLNPSADTTDLCFLSDNVFSFTLLFLFFVKIVLYLSYIFLLVILGFKIS